MSASVGRYGVQVERWQQRLDQVLESIEQPILDEIDRLNHNVDDLDAVRTDRDRRVRSLGSVRVAGIDLTIRTIERTARVELDHCEFVYKLSQCETRTFYISPLGGDGPFSSWSTGSTDLRPSSSCARRPAQFGRTL